MLILKKKIRRRQKSMQNCPIDEEFTPQGDLVNIRWLCPWCYFLEIGRHTTVRWVVHYMSCAYTRNISKTSELCDTQADGIPEIFFRKCWFWKKNISTRHKSMQNYPVDEEINPHPGTEVTKLFPYSTQLSTKFVLLINVKMPSVEIYAQLSWAWKKYYNLGPDLLVCAQIF